MKKRIMILLLMVFAIGSLRVTIGASPLISQVLEKSGIREELSPLPTRAIEAIEHDAKLTQVEVNFITQSFNAAAVEQRVADYIEAHKNSQGLQGMADWYNTPLGKKIVQQEIQVGSLETYDKIRDYASEAKLHPLSEKRLKLIEGSGSFNRILTPSV